MRTIHSHQFLRIFLMSTDITVDVIYIPIISDGKQTIGFRKGIEGDIKWIFLLCLFKSQRGTKNYAQYL